MFIKMLPKLWSGFIKNSQQLSGLMSIKIRLIDRLLLILVLNTFTNEEERILGF